MAQFQPNDQQRKFLETSNTNLLVSASAGSGKTSTMIQKLLKILSEERVKISSLLVVTYTNAAASEIKLKLYNELSKLILTTEDIKQKEFLKTQLDNINNAEIGTLHSICKKLIVKYFYEIDESPDFSLLSDKEQKYFLDMAVNKVFNKHIVSDDNDFFELYDCYNSNRNDLKLKKIALQLYEYKISKIDYSSWQKRFLNNSYNDDLNVNDACNYLLDYYQKRMMGFSSQILKLKRIAEECDFSRYFDYTNSRYQFINEFSVVENFEKAVKVLSNLNLPPKPRCSSKANVDEQDFDAEIELFGKSFGGLLTALKEDFTSVDVDEIKKNILLSKKNVEKLLEIVDEIESTYNSIKSKKNSLDFNDLENKMLQLLNNDKIKETLKTQYKYIFVDEYQDINNKQEEILLNLVSENNYYMIGDVKQSIYAFRQSSPKIFIDKYNSFSNQSELGKVINFNINYRSDRNILEFANSVFDKIITKSTIGIDYEKESRFDSQKEYNGCNVSIDILSSEDELEEDEIEAKLIVDKISDIIKTKKADGTYYDFKDIAIILRSRGTFVKTLCNVLNQYQIPVKASINSDFFGTSEVGLLVSILKLISNYKDDISLIVVLKNLFGLSEEELMCIRAYDETISMTEVIIGYSCEDNIKEKINNCFVFIEECKKKLTYLTLRDLLHDIINEFDLLMKIKLGKNGQEKANNILEFLKIIDNPNYQYNIDAFLEYLEIISKDNTPKTIGASNNAVEICTIHHSKGLEYPVVILGRLGKKFQLNKDSGNIIINGRFGVGLKSIDNVNRTLNETIIRSASKIDNKKSEIDEEIRLLYVAMTRAKEKLCLIGCCDLEKLSFNARKDIYYLLTPFDMIFKSIESLDLKYFENKSSFVINEHSMKEASVIIHKAEEYDFIEKSEQNPIVLDSINQDIVSVLLDNFNKRPELKVTTIKNTVTNILREESDYENVNFLPNKLTPNDSVVGKEVLKVGTAYHAVMQELKFTENYIEIEELISRLVADGKIDKELKSLIKIEEILKCISVLKDYIINADKVYAEKQFLLCENYNKIVDFTDNNTKVIVQGVIDLVIEKDGEVYLIDYKTNRGVSAEELSKMYALQLAIYSKAFEYATGKAVTRKFLYSFKLGKLIEII